MRPKKRLTKEPRLRALADAVEAYEREFGVLTPAEVAAQSRADRRRAPVVHPQKAGRRP